MSFLSVKIYKFDLDGENILWFARMVMLLGEDLMLFGLRIMSKEDQVENILV